MYYKAFLSRLFFPSLLFLLTYSLLSLSVYRSLLDIPSFLLFYFPASCCHVLLRSLAWFTHPCFSFSLSRVTTSDISFLNMLPSILSSFISLIYTAPTHTPFPFSPPSGYLCNWLLPLSYTWDKEERLMFGTLVCRYALPAACFRRYMVLKLQVYHCCDLSCLYMSDSRDFVGL